MSGQKRTKTDNAAQGQADKSPDVRDLSPLKGEARCPAGRALGDRAMTQRARIAIAGAVIVGRLAAIGVFLMAGCEAVHWAAMWWDCRARREG